MKRCRRFLAAACLLLASAGDAHADSPSETLAVDAARTLFLEGTAHFRAARWSPALAAFERSYAMVPSPNTMLMIARSHRELGRAVEAAEAYEKASLEAAQRIARGDSKYAPTERAADEEGRKTRAALGRIRVRVARAEGAAVTIDGRAALLDSAGTTTALHTAGNASVVVRDASGSEQRQTVSVLAGSTVEMEFSGDASPTTTISPPPSALADAPRADDRPPSRSWAIPAAIGGGLLTLAGTAVFIGFGSASHSTYERLEAQCGPSFCGPEERDDAATAKRQQTAANIGIVAAGIAAVSTVAFVVVALTSPKRP